MTQIKLRRDTSANFTSKNPVLGVGEPAYETDTKKLKIGDGTTAYNSLDYFSSDGGGSTNITATLPLKIVDGAISLEVDGQTIQIVDGKLHANLDELGNEVNTLAGDVASVQADLLNKQDKSTAVTINTDQDVTGAKSFTTGLTTFKNTDNIRKVLGEINGNGHYCNYYTSRDSGEKPCYLGKVSKNSFNMGIPDLKGVTGRIFANTLTKYNGSNEIGTILSTDILGSYVDGTTITYTNGKLTSTGLTELPIASTGTLGGIKVGDNLSITADGTLSATSGSSEPPTNMVTTDTTQAITGAKTFDKITLPTGSGTKGIYIEGKNYPSISAEYGTLAFSDVGYFQCETLYVAGRSSKTGEITLGDYPTSGSSSINFTGQKDGGVRSFNGVSLNIPNETMKVSDNYATTVIQGKSIVDKDNNKFLTSGDVSAYVIEEYVNGTEGYRVWSNRRGEQWGSFVGPKSITFLKNYADTDYMLLAYVTLKTSGEAYNGVFGTKKQATGFTADGLAGTTGDAYIIDSCGTVNWYTSGVLAP